MFSTDDVGKIRDLLEKVPTTVANKATVELYRLLIASPSSGGTPRDTGFAAACWIPSVGYASTLVGGHKESGKASVSWTAARFGLAQVLGTRGRNLEFFLTNNCEYIDWLEYKSRHAGFIQNAVNRVAKMNLPDL